jgi:acyl-CoA thioesterase YciA
MELISSKMCMSKDIGMNENLFGGNMLMWMDEIAAIYAHRTTGEPRMVTLRFGETIFKRPVKKGDVVDFYCGNHKIGNTSINFDIVGKIGKDDVFTTSCTFVAIDENGNKKEINKKTYE